MFFYSVWPHLVAAYGSTSTCQTVRKETEWDVYNRLGCECFEKVENMSHKLFDEHDMNTAASQEKCQTATNDHFRYWLMWLFHDELVNCLTRHFLKIFFWLFVPLFFDRTAKEWTGNGRGRRNDTQQRAAGGIKPAVAAARTQPLYVRCLLYHLSQQASQ